MEANLQHRLRSGEKVTIKESDCTTVYLQDGKVFITANGETLKIAVTDLTEPIKVE